MVTRLPSFGWGVRNSLEHPDPAANDLAVKSVQKGKKDFRNVKGNRFCDHCQRSGHTSDECFKIIRYPDWYQGPKDNSRPKTNARVAII